jgi:hypothetical protein
MELTTLRSQARKYTRTNSTNYPDATLDADINIINGEIWMMILEAEGVKNMGGDFKVLDHEDTSALTPQELGYNGEYPFPSIALKLEEVYVKYATADDYVKADIVDKSEIDSEMFNDNGIYDKSAPKVFVYRDSYFIRPLLTDTTVTDGIKLLIQQRQKTIVGTITDASTQVLTPEFESNFHNLIPLKVAQDWYLTYPDKYNPRIDKKADELEAQLISFYQDRHPNVVQMKPINGDRGLKSW